MKKIYYVFASCLFSTLWFSSAYGQSYQLTGADLCSDGSQSTTISLSDSDPAKYYALFRDNQLLAIQQCASGTSPNQILFGNFSEPGVYTAAEFNSFKSDVTPSDGKAIAGQVRINRVPLIYITNKPLVAKSGERFLYQPISSIKESEFTWTAKVVEGKPAKFDKNGKGLIDLTFALTDGKPAKVIFSITPIAPSSSGGCMGDPGDLTVIINP